MNPETNWMWLLGINFPALLLQKISFSLVEASKNISQDSVQHEFLFFAPYLARAEEFHPQLEGESEKLPSTTTSGE